MGAAGSLPRSRSSSLTPTASTNSSLRGSTTTATSAGASSPELSVDVQERTDLRSPPLSTSAIRGALAPFRNKQPNMLKRAHSEVPRMIQSRASCSACVPPDYDYSRSTQANYRQPNGQLESYGPYRDIRDSLDKDYHGAYSRPRQAVQDQLVHCVVDPHKARQQLPWIVFTAGAMGAGKSRTVNWLAAHGHFPLQDIVQVDPDVFRTAFPEWGGYLRRDPLTAGAHTHREAGYLVELTTEAAMRSRKHVWVDGSMRDGAWYKRFFEDIKVRFPHYGIAILHVDASREVVEERVRRRAEETGRHVPAEELADSLRRVPETVAALAHLCEFVASIDNSGDEPVLTAYKDRDACVAAGSTRDHWDELTQRFTSRPMHDQGGGLGPRSSKTFAFGLISRAGSALGAAHS